MNKILSALSVFALVFAMVFGTVQVARAFDSGGNLTVRTTGETNWFAIDNAHNSTSAHDRGSAPVANFESYRSGQAQNSR